MVEKQKEWKLEICPLCHSDERLTYTRGDSKKFPKGWRYWCPTCDGEFKNTKKIIVIAKGSK